MQMAPGQPLVGKQRRNSGAVRPQWTRTPRPQLLLRPAGRETVQLYEEVTSHIPTNSTAFWCEWVSVQAPESQTHPSEWVADVHKGPPGSIAEGASGCKTTDFILLQLFDSLQPGTGHSSTWASVSLFRKWSRKSMMGLERWLSS